MDPGPLRRCRWCPHRRRLPGEKRPMSPKDKTLQRDAGAVYMEPSPEGQDLPEEVGGTNRTAPTLETQAVSTPRTMSLLGDADCHCRQHGHALMVGPAGNEASTRQQRRHHLQMWLFRTSQGSLWHTALHGGAWLGQHWAKLPTEMQGCMCKEPQRRGSDNTGTG